MIALLAVLAASPTYTSVRIDGMPHVEQKPDFCGEACVEMALSRLGHPGDQDWVFDQSGLDPQEGRGVYTRELHVALKAIGFETGSVWHRVKATSAAQEVEALWGELHADLAGGVPSIICMHSDASAGATEHFRLIVGYDHERDEVLYHEPAAKNGAYRRMKRSALLSLWPLKYDADAWTVIRFRLDPRRLLPAAATHGPTDADYAQRVLELEGRAPEGFTILIEKPFVVIGDGGPAEVKRIAEGTVRWAVEKLKAQYFDRDPEAIIDVWVFKDDASYLANTRALFNERPSTPYGYYSPRHHALIMNIGTGGGTLVHEIVHPFVEANFPNAPDWLNEGLGSLYEQSDARDDKIVGLPNWRLPGLQEALRHQMVPTFAELMANDDFYEDDPGTNYAQSRYLLYYLQEHGLLGPYYRAFLANRAADPTGYATLQKVLGEKDMVAFQRRWSRWVLALRYR